MILELIAEALRSLRANTLRSLLAMLGMIIGVGSVVLMLGIGKGTQLTVESSIASLGSNMLIVTPGSSAQAGVRFGGGTAQTLTFADAGAISRLSSVRRVAPGHTGNAQVVRGPQNWSSNVLGTTADYFDIRDWRVTEGRPLDETDSRGSQAVAVIGQTIVDRLFGDESPIGERIQIRGFPFTVIGVLEKKGQSLDGRDQDDTIIIPIFLAQRRIFGNPFRGTVRIIFVQAEHADLLDTAEKDITQLLRQRHRIAPGQENDFYVRNLTALAETAAGAAKATSLMLGAIAGISLIVGGIGIMNIMLVSVTERTREIGLRRAIGAKRRDILWQFLFEAIMLCSLGGGLGLLGGMGAGWFLANTVDMPVVMTLPTMIWSFAAAALTGIFFGFAPARRAAMLEPAEALRQ